MNPAVNLINVRTKLHRSTDILDELAIAMPMTIEQREQFDRARNYIKSASGDVQTISVNMSILTGKT